MDRDRLEKYLEGFKKLPGTADDKFKLYAKEVREGNGPGATSLRHTFGLLKSGTRSARAHQIPRALGRRRFMILYGPVSPNHGQLLDMGTWDPETKMRTHGIILVDNRYEGNWIGTACVLAHELRHVFDLEETELGRLDIRESFLNDREPQFRANVSSGGVAVALGWRGYKDIYQHLSPAQWAEIAKVWGPKWRDTEDMWAQIDAQVAEFRAFMKHKGKVKAQRCGRPCKESKYGLCDRKVYFPPCWDH